MKKVLLLLLSFIVLSGCTGGMRNLAEGIRLAEEEQVKQKHK